MKSRITLAAAMFSILMIGLMLGTVVLVARLRVTTQVKLAEAERMRALMAEREVRLFQLQTVASQLASKSQPQPQAEPAPASPGPEIEKLRRENDELRRRLKGLEDASKIKDGPPAQAPPDAFVVP